ncbi:MAG: hypothetical protein ACQES4_04075 [Bacillota bacterium]
MRVHGRDFLYFNRFIAERGVCLVEDLESEVVQQVRAGGELIVLPLRLTGVSSAPRRVVGLLNK